MKLLIDNQLPEALAEFLVANGIDARHGAPPQVVWARLGNVPRSALLKSFAAVLPALRDGLENGTAVIEIG